MIFILIKSSYQNTPAPQEQGFLSDLFALYLQYQDTTGIYIVGTQ